MVGGERQVTSLVKDGRSGGAVGGGGTLTYPKEGTECVQESIMCFTKERFPILGNPYH